jgi:hydroxymethylglutaryl-CoA reductase (NADPH)
MGNAVGMNMISKDTEMALKVMQKKYPNMIILSLLGNYCQKPPAINWIEGHSQSMVADVSMHMLQTSDGHLFGYWSGSG